MMQQPVILLLKEDISQGPRGMDKLIINSTQTGEPLTTITNDGATLMDLLDVEHPAARILVDVSKAQDRQIGDGTTSAVVLAGAFLEAARPFIEEGIYPQSIIRAYRKAKKLALDHLPNLFISTPTDRNAPEYRETLIKCAETALNSKLIALNKTFFGTMAVDAVHLLDPNLLDLSFLGIKKIAGGSVEDSLLVKGVCFKKTFSYAGFEQQPKLIKNPKILALSVELELKSEAPNAEIQISASEFQKVVNAEWKIIYDKLDNIIKTGATCVFSKLPIGDLATQYFADRNIFSAGRVAESDLNRICQATGAKVQNICSNIDQSALGTCGLFQEKQIGGNRFNFLTECPQTATATIILRGGADQFLAESERSLHDAIMIVRRAVKSSEVVAGGGAVEMELSKFILDYARSIPSKEQMFLRAYAKALEKIPLQLANNCGFDSTDVINQLRASHAKADGSGKYMGININEEGICDTKKSFVWEPVMVKGNAIKSATEAAILILSIDETIKNDQRDRSKLDMPPGMQNPMGMGMGGGMPPQMMNPTQ